MIGLQRFSPQAMRILQWYYLSFFVLFVLVQHNLATRYACEYNQYSRSLPLTPCSHSMTRPASIIVSTSQPKCLMRHVSSQVAPTWLDEWV